MEDVVSIRTHESTDKLIIYPNPSEDVINIAIDNANKATIEIYNLIGRLIYSKTASSKTEKIDVSDYTTGIYLIKVKQADRIYIEKVVVR